MTRRARAILSRDALRHNLQVARCAAPGARLLAVIKADGYGHGLREVAAVLADGVDGFAVASVGEGLALREAGVARRVLVLHGALDAAEVAAARRAHLTLVVHHAAQLALQPADPAQAPAVWVKIDTGMGRLGLPAGEAARACRRLGAACQGVLSHLANADQPGHPANDAQLRRFRRATAGLPYPRSLANSAALLRRPDTHFDWVRPGLMLYGVSPLQGVTGAGLGLRPVMDLEAPLIAVNRHRAGEAIGYGGDWVCPEDMPVGVVAIGYGDGYPRHAPSGTPVRLRGVEVPVVGRVSMDSLCIDLRRCPAARPGDRVQLWGAGLPVERIAAHAGTIGYELLCSAGGRCRREWR